VVTVCAYSLGGLALLLLMSVAYNWLVMFTPAHADHRLSLRKLAARSPRAMFYLNEEEAKHRSKYLSYRSSIKRQAIVNRILYEERMLPSPIDSLIPLIEVKHVELARRLRSIGRAGETLILLDSLPLESRKLCWESIKYTLPAMAEWMSSTPVVECRKAFGAGMAIEALPLAKAMSHWLTCNDVG
jgi:hypothetical protein